MSVVVGPNDELIVADWLNNRVMLFPTGSQTSTEVSAFELLGQATFQSTQSDNSLSGLNGPAQVAYDPIRDTLWVADSANNRILRFSNISTVVVHQLSSLNVVVGFQGNLPNLYAYPKGKSLP